MRLVPAGGRGNGAMPACRPRPRWAATTAAVAGVLLLAGCRVPLLSSSSGEPSVTATITVAATPGVANAPLYIGIQEGLFHDVGLTVRLLPVRSAKAAAAALEHHQANFAFGDYADMFYLQANLEPASQLQLVADGYDAEPDTVEVLTLPGHGVVTPQDLSGKTIGTPEPQAIPAGGFGQGGLPYSLETVATESVLTNDNVDPARINWQPMPASKLLGALQSGGVDAIVATEPTIYQAESHGAVPVLDACTGQTANLPLDGYFTTSSFAAAQPDVVNAFRYALEKAQAAAGLAAPVQQALVKYAKWRPQTAAVITVGTYPTSMKADNVQRVADLIFLFNMIPSPLDVSGMVAR